jgi:hypothetical protein
MATGIYPHHPLGCAPVRRPTGAIRPINTLRYDAPLSAEPARVLEHGRAGLAVEMFDRLDGGGWTKK